MKLWFPSASTIIELYTSMGGSPSPSTLSRVERTTEATARRMVHLGAGALLWDLASDGPFEARTPLVALAATHNFYAQHGWRLLGRDPSELQELAIATAAGRVTEEDVAVQLQERAHPPPFPR